MNHMFFRAFLVAELLAFGCGGDDDDGGAPDAAVEVDAAAPDAPAPDAPPAGTRIAATVIYDGTVEGTLVLAAFTSVPPAGPPAGFAQDSSPTFPATLAIEDLEPGTLYVLALLDAPPASPTQPGPEDLQAWSDALEVLDGETTTVELTLEDP